MNAENGPVCDDEVADTNVASPAGIRAQAACPHESGMFVLPGVEDDEVLPEIRVPNIEEMLRR